ncbi:hypothetical protein [Erwinia sp. CGal63]|uniref:hypothetical protein n=1 Tax=Erwinia sp. CGal63 TaxID=2919889 RepID=UPI00300B9749
MQQKNCDKSSYACYLCNSSQKSALHQPFRFKKRQISRRGASCSAVFSFPAAAKLMAVADRTANFPINAVSIPFAATVFIFPSDSAPSGVNLLPIVF